MAKPKQPRRTPMSYRTALFWIVDNDDTDWLFADPKEMSDAPSVTTCLVADVYRRTIEEVTADLRKLMRRAND